VNNEWDCERDTQTDRNRLMIFVRLITALPSVVRVKLTYYNRKETFENSQVIRSFKNTTYTRKPFGGITPL